MTITYTKYAMHYLAPNTFIEKGTIELPETGAGLRYRLRQAFPGFEFTHTLNYEADQRMRLHNADWTIGIVIEAK